MVGGFGGLTPFAFNIALNGSCGSAAMKYSLKLLTSRKKTN